MHKDKMQIKVMVFGTFDIFHSGHRSFLKQAKKKGDYLIAVVARNKTVAEVKKRAAKNDEKSRLAIIRKSGLADKAILGSLRDKYAVIKKYRPDVICLGYDQKFFIENLKNKLIEVGLTNTRIFRMRSYKPEIYKSSKLRGQK